MRTTLAIDDDVLAAVKDLAEVQRKSVGEVLSSLVRAALTPRATYQAERNGFPLLKSRGSRVLVTSELVRQIDEETP